MLISQKHKFIFVHIYKNAGTSITKALMPFSINKPQHIISGVLLGKGQRQINRILGKVNPKFDPQPYHDHIKASELAERLGKDVFKSFFSFAIVRNPWDWQVSLYKYMIKNTNHFQHKLVKGFGSFDEYIKWRCIEEVQFQKDFVCSEDGELLVDFLGSFERLNADFQSICSHLGISASLPKLNVSTTTPYQQYYNEETKKLIERTFEPDIQLFGYEFE